jgi:hypothetical protein
MKATQQVITTYTYLGFNIVSNGRCYSVISPSGLFLGSCPYLYIAKKIINNIKTLITDEQSRAGLGC